MADRQSVDTALLNELVALLATLEHDRARMAERKADPQGLAGLDLLADVVNALVVFVTTRSDDSSVLPSRVLARLADDDPYTQLLGEDGERVTVATAAAVLSGWTGSDEDRRRMLDDLSRALMDVLGVYSESIADFFHNAPLRDEWRSTFAIFADDLRHAAQRLAA